MLCTALEQEGISSFIKKRVSPDYSYLGSLTGKGLEGLQTYLKEYGILVAGALDH